jgi:ABC-type branched-subunit amino acid transport system substrate-binding protein
MRVLLLLILLASPLALRAELKLALLGPFAEEKSVETLSAQAGVDAHNAVSGAARLRLQVVDNGGTVEGSLKAAQALVADAEVLGVVLHGEAAADPSVLKTLNDGGLAVVAASSWATPRLPSPGMRWLSPGLPSIADVAATYARKEAKVSQVAVVDNGAPTASAAGKTFTQRFRAQGGKVPLDLTWSGEDEALDATVKALAAHWPQMVFFAGEAADAGRLIKAMQGEKALNAADLILLPNGFEPAFFDNARMLARRTRAIFPCPDYIRSGFFIRQMGFAFLQASPEYRAYIAYNYKHPGRWTPMLFDAVWLLSRALREAGEAAASAEAPGRADVLGALEKIDGYRGARGAVKFDAQGEPTDNRVMVYYALNKVNRKMMYWSQKAWGPPF